MKNKIIKETIKINRTDIRFNLTGGMATTNTNMPEKMIVKRFLCQAYPPHEKRPK